MVRVAAVQMQPALLDVPANLKRVLESARQAAAHGARLIVLPEMALSGYAITPDEAQAVAQTIAGPATDSLRAACAASRSAVVVGILERDADGMLYNASVLKPQVSRRVHCDIVRNRLMETNERPTREDYLIKSIASILRSELSHGRI